MTDITAIGPYHEQAQTLLENWEKGEEGQLPRPIENAELKAHLLESLSLYIERQNASSQSEYMEIYQQLTNTLSTIRALKGMPLYAILIEEWNGQNLPQSNRAQADAALLQDQGLQPTLP